MSADHETAARGLPEPVMGLYCTADDAIELLIHSVNALAERVTALEYELARRPPGTTLHVHGNYQRVTRGDS
jgi:hypothetical protein